MLSRTNPRALFNVAEKVSEHFLQNILRFCVIDNWLLTKTTQFLQTLAVGNQRRTLMLQENQGMTVLEKAGIAVPKYGVARTAEEAKQHATTIG